MSEVLRPMIQGKIHRATVTGADLHYVGSVTIDADLLDAADILEGQQVDISDIANGNRLTTYVIAGPRGSGMMQLNGAAAHLVSVGDLVIVMAYAQVPESRARQWRPRVIFVDGDNQILHSGDDAGAVPGGNDPEGPHGPSVPGGAPGDGQPGVEDASDSPDARARAHARALGLRSSAVPHEARPS